MIMSNYNKIPLSNGGETLVDTEDFLYLNRWKWHKSKNGYAVRTTTNKQISLHKQIMGDVSGYEVDHINRDKLDNRRHNLRLVNGSQNNLNRPVDPRSKTGYNGITITKSGSFRVRVSHKEFGRFKKLEDAINQRNMEVDKIFLISCS